MERPRRAEYTPNDLLTFRESGALDITPKFQRRGVWRLPQRSYFLDSLLRQMPVPPIYLRETQADDYSKTVRQVIDGQQRIRAVLEYIEGDYSISRGVPGDWAGKPFEKLSSEEQNRVRNYHFTAEVFIGISDAEVLDVFARMNTYSVQLNKQELRNGKYFGWFKQCCYELAHEHLEFWRDGKIFTEQAIARMSEVELTSECVIFILDGPQDKKTSIDHFYAEHDEEFPQASDVQKKFRGTIDLISDLVPSDILRDSAFRRVPLFYSLFGAVHHARYGTSMKLPSYGRSLKKEERESMRAAILRLSAVVEAARAGEEVPSKYQRFVTACLRQTDNIQPRRIRIVTLLAEAGVQ